MFPANIALSKALRRLLISERDAQKEFSHILVFEKTKKIASSQKIKKAITNSTASNVSRIKYYLDVEMGVFMCTIQII